MLSFRPRYSQSKLMQSGNRVLPSSASSLGDSMKIRYTLTAIAAASMLVITGCAGGGTAPDKPADLKDSGQEIESVKVAFPGSLANLYVGQESGILNYYLAGNMQEGLVSIDSDGKFIPALATEWDMPDDKTYVFTIREDAKFQNGDPLTPEDIIFSTQQAQDPELSPGTYWYLLNVASVEQTGDFEITYKLTKPDSAFLTNLATVGALVVTQKKFWEEHDGKVGTSSSLLMGTGAYQATEFVPDSHVTLDRVDTWWGGVPKAKQIRVDFIPDENTRLLAAQKGDIDIAFNVPIKQAEQWKKIADGRVEAVNDLSYVGLLFDNDVKPFDDANVRAAIASAIDRDVIVDKLLRGYGEVANAIMTPETLSKAYDPEEARKLLASLPQNDFDLDHAKELLADSAGAGGFEVELTYPNTGPHLGVAGQAIAENLKPLGIDVTVREVPIEEWLATLGDGEHGLGFMWYFSTTGEPSEINGYLLGEGNDSHISDAKAQELIDASSAETDPKKRIDILMELEKLNLENTYAAPLWWGQSISYFDNSIGVKDFTAFTFLGPWGSQLFAAE